ncbi:hypothetical protein ACFSTC_57775 [Nonomuraea ferruginea]
MGRGGQRRVRPRVRERLGDYTTGDFAEVMGHQARAFEAFAADHADRLGG